MPAEDYLRKARRCNFGPFFLIIAIVYQNRIVTRGKKQILLFLSRCRKELERKTVVTKSDLKVAQF